MKPKEIKNMIPIIQKTLGTKWKLKSQTEGLQTIKERDECVSEQAIRIRPHLWFLQEKSDRLSFEEHAHGVTTMTALEL